jgi:hypothetical protein
VEASNSANVYVQSLSNRSRNKILVRMEGLRLVRHPRRIVAAFEETASDACHEADGEDLRTAVESRWMGLALRSER